MAYSEVQPVAGAGRCAAIGQALAGAKDTISNNKGKTALIALAVLAATGLGLAFGLNATRPAMLNFFAHTLPHTYQHSMIARLVTLGVGGAALGALSYKYSLPTKAVKGVKAAGSAIGRKAMAAGRSIKAAAAAARAKCAKGADSSGEEES